MLKGADVALVSEAGTPTIRDPGLQLIREALAAGFSVTPVPGASSVTTALAASGLPSDQFVFLGYLPSRRTQRRHLLGAFKGERRTLVAFEAPHRLLNSLEDVIYSLGDRTIVIGREITKVYEEWFRGAVSEAIEHFRQPRGEFTLVIQGAEEKPSGSESEALERLRTLRARGAKAQEAVKEVTLAFDMPRRAVYRLWLTLE